MNRDRVALTTALVAVQLPVTSGCGRRGEEAKSPKPEVVPTGSLIFTAAQVSYGVEVHG